jgi:hypothetical protein
VAVSAGFLALVIKAGVLMMNHRSVAAAIICLFLSCADVRAQVPQMINYQGRVLVDSTNFDGTGQFKFALINAATGDTLWRNSGAPGPGEPAQPVSLPVSRGLYSVLLGDATLPNMNVIPNTVFNSSDVRLRVWFSDGGAAGFQQLDPDQRIAAVGYAMVASSVVDGAIGAAKIAPGAVTANKLDPTLSAELPRTNAGQTFTGANNFSNPGNQFTGNGSGLRPAQCQRSHFRPAARCAPQHQCGAPECRE